MVSLPSIDFYLVYLQVIQIFFFNKDPFILLYVPFLADFLLLKNMQLGEHKCASGGEFSGVWSNTIFLLFFTLPLAHTCGGHFVGQTIDQGHEGQPIYQCMS